MSIAGLDENAARGMEQLPAKQEPVAVTQHGLKILSQPLTDLGALIVSRGRMNFHRTGEPSGSERTFDRLWDQRRKGWPIGLGLPRPRLTEEERDTIAFQRRAIFGHRTAEWDLMCYNRL